LVAYINLFCYYLMGLPLGFLLGYKGGYRVQVMYLHNHANIYHTVTTLTNIYMVRRDGTV